MTRVQLLDGFEGITLRNILSHISVPQHQHRRDQVLGFVIDKFIKLVQRFAVTDDRVLMLPTGMLLKDNFFLKAVTYRLFQQLLGDKVFPAIILLQPGDPYFAVDPELEKAMFDFCVKKIPLSWLKPCLELVHRSRRKCLLSAPRDELREALRMSVLEQWNELLVAPPPLIGTILNCYIADANYQSFYSIRDLMDYEFGRDLFHVALWFNLNVNEEQAVEVGKRDLLFISMSPLRTYSWPLSASLSHATEGATFYMTGLRMENDADMEVHPKLLRAFLHYCAVKADFGVGKITSSNS
ncbi:hypothetical protein ARMGADRAFT_1140564 [Armillaria gallica]|uniref:Uncharacterized protein n=1 Tax=Armillaria gallica TaxID=47427 RepID=A0A2H3CLH9_ARMGA|nr:hypothetical protein ARMGADRAFT_1140564 [Armillaria gallica]